DSCSCNSPKKRCENVAGVTGSMKKLDGCSVTPTSAAKFDWSVGIFATTAMQTGLAANTTARHVNCQNLIAPCTPDICLLRGSTGLAFFFVAEPGSVNVLSRMLHICHLFYKLLKFRE